MQNDETDLKRVRVAYGSVPKESGTFTFYRNQRPALLEHGVDLQCVSVGAEQAGLWRAAFADEGCVLIAAEETNPARQAQAFAQWCDQEAIDIVIGINSPAILSSLPHLPERIRVIARCANAFHEGYQVTVACYERLAKIVALTPRLWDDLVESYDVASSKLVLIPNGVCPDTFAVAADQPRGEDGCLRLGFLGRLEHNQKGVLFLPDIVRRLAEQDFDFRLRIAGTGKHEAQLRRELQPQIESGLVEFVGALDPRQVPVFLGEADVFVFTSQFEGCPNALLEAMMAGAVPVAWRIPGITDFILDDVTIGSLCELGDCNQFADAIVDLHAHRSRLRAMSLKARTTALERFTIDGCAGRYAEVFREVMQDPAPSWSPRPWNEFQIDVAFQRKGWRRWLPTSLIRKIKKIRGCARVT